MPYVSAKYAPEIPDMPPYPEGEKQVIATDENGVEWWLQENSEVGDWLRYIEGGGTIDPADEEPEPEPEPEEEDPDG